jgi:hypothetical protein
VGGSSKFDSLQNVLLLRSDLHYAWDNHCFAVNPSVCIFPLLASISPFLGLNSYSEDMLTLVTTPLLPGYDDIAGKASHFEAFDELAEK